LLVSEISCESLLVSEFNDELRPQDLGFWPKLGPNASMYMYTQGEL